MRNTIKKYICQTVFFIRYKLLSRHKYGHGIHSPFVFDFVRNVLRGKTSCEDFHKISQIRKKLLRNKEIIKYDDIGEVSRKLSRIRTISEIYRTASVNCKFGRLLHRMVKYYKPASILEIGSSLGISSLYMASGNSDAELITIEGVEQIVQIAQRNFKNSGQNNIIQLKGTFDEKLPELFQGGYKPEFTFIDGNHTYEATIRYFGWIYNSMEQGIIILDDIYWSCEMRKAWDHILAKSQVSIDIFQFGIIVKKDSLTPGNYMIRF